MIQELNQNDWAYKALNVQSAWSYISTKQLQGIKVAYIDTGCNVEMDFFKEIPFKCIDSDGNISKIDRVGHGTFFGSVLSRYLFYEDNVYTEIISIKAGDSPQLSVAELCKSIQIAINYKVDVLNIGACNLYYNPKVAQLISKAVEMGMIIISPSGNNVFDTTTYPASLDTVISCASLNKEMKYFNQSNVNQFVDIFVPGENIIGVLPPEQASCVKGNGLAKGVISLSGTSFAAAILTAAAVYVKSKWRNINNYKFMQSLHNFGTLKCKVDLAQGITIERNILDFYLIMNWLDNNFEKISCIDFKQRYIHWLISNSGGTWFAEAYNQYGERNESCAKKVQIELFARNNLKEKLKTYDINCFKGKVQWEFGTLEAGQYIMKLNDFRLNSVYPTVIITISPETPEVIQVVKKDDMLEIYLKDISSTVYYSFKNNALRVDPRKGQLKDTYLYDKSYPIVLLSEQQTVKIASFNNGVFSQTVIIEYNQYI